MSEAIQIKGGAGPYEAAVVAAVIQEVLESERRVRAQRPEPTNRPSAWVRALHPRNPEDPLFVIRPDHRGDPL